MLWVEDWEMGFSCLLAQVSSSWRNQVILKQLIESQKTVFTTDSAFIQSHHSAYLMGLVDSSRQKKAQCGAEK